MAGIKLNQSVKASSIVEVLIAMIVIVVVFSIAMGIFANVQRLSLSGKKILAQAVLREQLLIAERSLTRSRKELVINGITVTQDISSYRDSEALFKIELKAFDDNRDQITEIKEVVYDKK